MANDLERFLKYTTTDTIVSFEEFTFTEPIVLGKIKCLFINCKLIFVGIGPHEPVLVYGTNYTDTFIDCEVLTEVLH
jgi:hypothetical protein